MRVRRALMERMTQRIDRTEPFRSREIGNCRFGIAESELDPRPYAPRRCCVRIECAGTLAQQRGSFGLAAKIA